MKSLATLNQAPKHWTGAMKDKRSENWMKNAPDLVETPDGWRLEGFVPLSTAENYGASRHAECSIYGFHFDGLMKIGRSSNPERRLMAIQKWFGSNKLEVVGTLSVPYAGSYYAERLMHVQFEDRMLEREWFNISPAEFLEFLPLCEIGAKLYDDACRDWHEATLERANYGEME